MVVVVPSGKAADAHMYVKSSFLLLHRRCGLVRCAAEGETFISFAKRAGN